ncbi:SAV_2336 N-terminal domain-related protein [Streptomyces sp. N35]|uniref:SAV_2336 N-terminal domain-related protein n=1 Tax=Streptomyces sp. N35 TaxID=2795730 RepID=UPI0018F547CE|nr:SAV_2336 N-terminal domain-related protein [Streptomyces sp. N35]
MPEGQGGVPEQGESAGREDESPAQEGESGPAREGESGPAREGESGPARKPASDDESALPPAPVPEDASVARLARVLAEAGGHEDADAGPTSVELAELLWLARQMSAPEPAPSTPPRPRPRTPDKAAPGHVLPPPADHSPKPEPPPPAPRVPVHLPDPAPSPEHPRETPAADDGTYTTLLAPAPPMLPRPLTLQRALRPLKRRVPAPAGVELDETATAERIARLAAPPQWWLPVLRPAQERWLRLRIVYDDGPTMPIWRPLLRELCTVFGQSGIFRTLDVHRLSASGAVRGAEGTPADGRTVTLVVSDCMGPQWRDGSAGRRWYATLNRWASRHPVAIVQPLPERLWRTTALPATPTTLSAPWPAAPNSAYSTADPDEECLIVPVLEPSASWLANWAALVAGSGPVPGAAAALAPAPPPAPLDEAGRTDVQRLGPEELLLRFRSIASPEAFRLAGHLAVGRPHLPYMRLVQAALEPRPQPGHLAEVILSGLLRAVPGEAGSYVFREGVRDLLLGTLPRTSRLRTRDLLARLGAPIDDRAGIVAGEFRVAVPGGTERGPGGAEVATVRAESVDRMGGPAQEAAQPAGPAQEAAQPAGPAQAPAQPVHEGLFGERYELVRPLGHGARRVWLARDVETRQPVALQRFRGIRQDSVRGRAFEQRARSLATVRHPHVVTVLDHGFDGDSAYIAMEYLEGISLDDLLRGAGTQVSIPFWLTALVARQTAHGLAAAHRQSLSHGPLKVQDILIGHDGAVRIAGFMDSDTSHSPAADGAELDAMLRHFFAPDLSEPGRLRDWRRLAGLPLTGARDTSRTGGTLDLLTSRDFDPIEAAAVDQLPRFHLLGPQLCAGGERLSAQARAMLAMLLLLQGRSIPLSEIAAGIGEPAVAGPVERAAAELRQVLGPGLLARTPDGFAVHATALQIDAARVDIHVRNAGMYRQTGAIDEARQHLREALGLWRGEPLDGIPGPAAKRARSRLNALRLSLHRGVADYELELGEYDQAAAHLTDLVNRYPDDEEFRRLHMVALRHLGRIREAIESYERYRERFDETNPAPELAALHDELYRDLLGAQKRGRSAVVFEFLADSPDANDRAQDLIGRFVSELLARDLLDPDGHELLARTNGYLVLTDPGVSVLPLLPAVLSELHTVRGHLPPRVSLRVMFWHNAEPIGHKAPASLRHEIGPDPGDALVILSPPLYEEAMSGTIPLLPRSFSPLAPQGEVVAYVHRLSAGPAPAGTEERLTVERHLTSAEARYRDLVRGPEAGRRDLVRGPFPILDHDVAPQVNAATTAVVYEVPEEDEFGVEDDRYTDVTTRYYEVDLTLAREWRELPLPSAESMPFTASVELSWHVTDPRAFVEADVTSVATPSFDHLSRLLARITRRYTLGRLGAAQQAVQDAHFDPWPVPGLTVAASVRLSATLPGAPPPQSVQPIPQSGPAAQPIPPSGPAAQPPVDPSAYEAAARPAPSQAPVPPTEVPADPPEEERQGLLRRLLRRMSALPGEPPEATQAAEAEAAEPTETAQAQAPTEPTEAGSANVAQQAAQQAMWSAEEAARAHRLFADQKRREDAAREEGRRSPTRPPSRSPVTEALSTARTVLLGFDGPVVRLYAQHTATSVSRELARNIADLRHPDEALRGDRLLKGTPINPSEGYAHPYDLLRAIAHHRLAAPTAERLTQIELRMVTSSFPTAYADPLIRTLHAQGRTVGIVTDADPVVVSTYLDSRGLGGRLRGGIHGRATDLTRLMPHPDCLRRALAAADCAPNDALLITSTVAELEAAETLGITTIGYADGARARVHLEAAGCYTTITDLHPLLDAARETPPPRR